MEHTILVAVTVDTDTRQNALEEVKHYLDDVLDEYWIAEDDRIDGSDRDSAVFVVPGRQAEAARILYALGLTGAVNLLEHLDGVDIPFDGSPIGGTEQDPTHVLVLRSTLVSIAGELSHLSEFGSG